MARQPTTKGPDARYPTGRNAPGSPEPADSRRTSQDSGEPDGRSTWALTAVAIFAILALLFAVLQSVPTRYVPDAVVLHTYWGGPVHDHYVIHDHAAYREYLVVSIQPVLVSLGSSMAGVACAGGHTGETPATDTAPPTDGSGAADGADDAEDGAASNLALEVQLGAMRASAQAGLESLALVEPPEGLESFHADVTQVLAQAEVAADAIEACVADSAACDGADEAATELALGTARVLEGIAKL